MMHPPAVYNGVVVPYQPHRRPPVRWVGGKTKLAAWVIERLPRGGEIYVEPYAGSAAVLFALPKIHPIEVLNDVDEHLITLYRVLQNRAQFRDLMRRLVWTPYARAEFGRAIETLANPAAGDVDRAWAVFVVHNQSFGGLRVKTTGRWMRTFDPDNPAPASYRARLAELRGIRERLDGVIIDSRDGLEVMKYWDRPTTTFYVDPPYHPETRRDLGVYAADVDAAYTERLVDVLVGLEGQCAVSGYDHPVFGRLVDAGWERHVLPVATGLLSRGDKTAVDADNRRVEVLWVKRHTVGQGALW
jgi:DNA adenine methylase